ncbi:MAG: hypothetical protein AAGF11_20715 [Myxococcota bacterium]
MGVLALTACSSGTPTITSGGDDTTSGTSSTGPEITTVDPTTSVDDTTPGMTEPGTADGTRGESTGSDSGTTAAGCTPGAEGCPCDADTCMDDLTCVDGTCQGVRCDPDVFEDNEDEDNAYNLGDITSSDGDGSVVSASISPGDADWFRYHGEDIVSGNVDPARELVAAAPVRMCKFLECDNGLDMTEFECPDNAEYALSPMARPGCCITASRGGIELPDLNCTDVVGDDATVYLRVDNVESGCVSYSVSYHY